MLTEELRVSGISRTGLRWLTNPARTVLFKLLLPYFEVVARAVARTPEKPSELSGLQLADALAV